MRAGRWTPSSPGSMTGGIPARTGPARSAWWYGWRWRRPPATGPERMPGPTIYELNAHDEQRPAREIPRLFGAGRGDAGTADGVRVAGAGADDGRRCSSTTSSRSRGSARKYGRRDGRAGTRPVRPYYRG